MAFPSTLSINAYTGVEEPVQGKVTATIRNWGIKQRLDKVPRLLDAPEPKDRRKWQDPDIGWGLILPENEALSPQDRAAAVDAPEPIRALLSDRTGAPVFRYRADRVGFLTAYYPPNGASRQISLTSAGNRGIAPGRLPYYLLICGSPQLIPWRFQYLLNQSCYVGRLDLDPAGLENYVRALKQNWADIDSRADQPLVWAVDHNESDITHLMRRVIADPVALKLQTDPDWGAKVSAFAGDTATLNHLTTALAAKQPALIVTTSHGLTGPQNDPAQMAAQLGFPVDQQHTPVTAAALLAAWEPRGAIWYAHACCSAGSDASSSYTDLLDAASPLLRTLQAVAALGSQSAPLPQKLLGAAKPLRAFIGHVEPTFDWTLRQPQTGQVLARTITEALYDHLYQRKREPIAMAFADCYKHVGELLAIWESAHNDVANVNPQIREDARYTALVAQLTAFDRRSMVILGDPTACIPATPPPSP